MTNKEKALALINTFASGDTAKAKELLSKDYIQHNLAYGTGADAFVGAVEYLASAPVKQPLIIFVHLKTETRYFYKLYIILQGQVSR